MARHAEVKLQRILFPINKYSNVVWDDVSFMIQSTWSKDEDKNTSSITTSHYSSFRSCLCDIYKENIKTDKDECEKSHLLKGKDIISFGELYKLVKERREAVESDLPSFMCVVEKSGHMLIKITNPLELNKKGEPTVKYEDSFHTTNVSLEKRIFEIKMRMNREKTIAGLIQNLQENWQCQ